MKTSLLCTLVGLGLLVALPARGQDGTGLVTATDLFRIRQLEDVALSPDGRDVVYVVRSIVETPEGGHAYRTHLWTAPAHGIAPPRPLTSGDRSASQPAWHPDGDRLAFVRSVDGKPQVFVLPLYGGEATQLTHHEHGASSPQWSPDGTKLLFSASLSLEALHRLEAAGRPWPDERPGRSLADTAGVTPDPDGTPAQIRAWLARNARDDNPRVFNRLDLQDEHDLEPEPAYRHLFVVDVPAEPTPGAEAVPAPEPVRITRGFYSFGGGAWLPGRGGDRVVFSGAVVTDEHPDRVRDADLFTAGADGGGFRRLLDLEGYAVSGPAPAPDGQSLAFLARPLDDPGYGQTELGVLSLDARTPPRLLTLGFDRSVGAPRWSPDGWYLYFVAPSNGGFPLFRTRVFDVPPLSAAARPADTATVDTALVALDTAADTALVALDTLAAAPTVGTATASGDADEAAVERLTGYDAGVRSFDVGRATAFLVLTEATNPYELYALDLASGERERLTEHNALWLATKQLSRPRAFSITRDTLTIDYWVMPPVPFSENQSYPLLLQIHGGPSAMWGPGEASMWHEFQFFAARGFGIVYANPRGSGGYGHAFQRANYQDWGDGPAGDVLAAATEAARLPWTDPDRQVVTGGSYAGYLTAWIVGHDDRFKAAAAQRGVYDLSVFLGEGNAWRLVPSHFGGYPWDDAPLPRPDTAAAVPPEALPTLPVPSADTTLIPIDTTGTPERLFFTEDVAVTDTTDVTAAADTTVEARPATVRELLFHQSPITYVEQIRTPLLILHADDDLRTGVIQSEALYKSLKILERPVEYVRYPNAGHDLSRTGDPKQRLDRILRIYEFMTRFIDVTPRPQPPAETDR